MNRLDEQDAEDRRLLQEAEKKDEELRNEISQLTRAILLDRDAANRDRVGSRDILALVGKVLDSSHRPRTHRRRHR